MSQLGRSFATAASSFASKRAYAQNIRLPGTPLPQVIGTRSAPGSPSAASFFPFISGVAPANARNVVPGISPASQPHMNFWTTSPPSSPSQLHFRLSQQQPSPSLNINLGAFTPASSQATLTPAPCGVFDFGFGLSAGNVLSATPSPAHSGRSISPVSSDVPFAAPIKKETLFATSLVPRRRSSAVSDVSTSSKDGKKGLNPFTYYRKTFPARYPHIDALIPTQMERSRLTGAFWGSESPTVRAQCAAAVYVDRTPAQIERLENIRLQTSEKRKAERERAGTAELTGRNRLIFDLWKKGVSVEDMRNEIGEHDKLNPLPMPARKRRRKEPAHSRGEMEALILAEVLRAPTSSPQISTPDLTHSPITSFKTELSPVISFKPELSSAVFEAQETWVPLVSAFAQTGFDESGDFKPDVVTVEQDAPEVLTVQVSEHSAGALYDGLMDHYAHHGSPYLFGGHADMDRILDEYTYAPISQQDTDMDFDFIFTHDQNNTTLPPTEEDGLAFDVTFFGPASTSSP